MVDWSAYEARLAEDAAVHVPTRAGGFKLHDVPMALLQGSSSKIAT
jgi:hypothetical protein